MRGLALLALLGACGTGEPVCDRTPALTYHNFESSAPDTRAVVPIRTLQALLRAIPEDGEETVKVKFYGTIRKK